jgi:hypothetical protein
MHTAKNARNHHDGDDDHADADPRHEQQQEHLRDGKEPPPDRADGGSLQKAR